MKQNPTAANLAASLAAYITSNAPAGVNIRAKETREGLAVYILNAPSELIEWPELASNARRYAPLYLTQATAAGRDLYGQLRAIAARWSEDHGGVAIKGTTIWIGSPSRGFVPVAKDTPRPRQEKGGAPAIKYPRTLSARDRAIFAAIMAECEAVACRLHLEEGAPVPASFVELSERIGEDITGAPDAPRVVEVEGYRVECSAAALFGIAHRYARAFGIGYTAAPVCSLIAPAPAVEVEPLAVAVEVNRTPRPSFRKVFARLVVALLSLIVAGLRLLITCARLIERGRLLSVVASYMKGRVARAANAVALLLIIAGRRVAAAADYVEQL